MGLKPRAIREVYAEDRSVWRTWLARNHDRFAEVRLVFYRTSTGKPCIGYDEAVREALCFGWIDGIKHKLDEERYCFRFTPRSPKSKWSDSNKTRVAELEKQGLLRAPGIAVIDAARASGQWDKPARPPVPATIPCELERALAANPVARRAFGSLAPSHRREWWRYIADAKQESTRARRSAKCVAELLRR